MSCHAAAVHHTNFSLRLSSAASARWRWCVALAVVVVALVSPTSSSPAFEPYSLQPQLFFPQTWQELLRNYYSPWRATSDPDDSDDFTTYAKRQGENSPDLGERMRDYSFGLGKRGQDYAFGLGKRPKNDYSFGLGKRAKDDYSSGLGPRGKQFSFGLGKRAQDYAFGLGKRGKNFSFGLGKRYVDTSSVDEQSDNFLSEKEETHEDGSTPADSSSWSDAQNSLKSRRKREVDFDDELEGVGSTDLGVVNKRRNEFGFGLGKRNNPSGSGNRGRIFNFGLGKRETTSTFEYPKRIPNHYSFGLGKRGRPYSFGIGKRLPLKYSFGIGKRPDGDEDSSLEYHSPYSLLKYFGFTHAPASTSLRFGRRSYDFGLGKRSTEFPSYPQKKNRNEYGFGLGKRAGSRESLQDYDYGNNPNAFSFGLGKRYMEGHQNTENDHEEIVEENAD